MFAMILPLTPRCRLLPLWLMPGSAAAVPGWAADTSEDCAPVGSLPSHGSGGTPERRAFQTAGSSW